MIKINILEKKILKFLLSNSAYSDTAIMKNFGITKEELETIYNSLFNQGFLETYDNFIKNNPEFNETKNSCCNSNCDCSPYDTKNIKVLSKKALLLEDELSYL